MDSIVNAPYMTLLLQWVVSTLREQSMAGPGSQLQTRGTPWRGGGLCGLVILILYMLFQNEIDIFVIGMI